MGNGYNTDYLIAKHFYLGTQGLLMLMGLKFFDKDDQAIKH